MESTDDYRIITFVIDAAGLYRASIASGNYGVADYFENFVQISCFDRAQLLTAYITLHLTISKDQRLVELSCVDVRQINGPRFRFRFRFRFRSRLHFYTYPTMQIRACLKYLALHVVNLLLT